MRQEWDEAPELEKICFGDEVETSNGEVGRVTELDGESEFMYRVDNIGVLGWFTREELKKI